MPRSASVVELFRRLSSGVYIIGVTHNGRSNAFTAAWINQVSFDPLLLALSVNPGNFSFALLQQSGVFALNVLKKGQLDLARHFGTQSGRDIDKLAGHRWHPGELGAPILEDAAAYLECRVAEITPAGDHRLALSQVIGGEILDSAAEPMIYTETGNLDGSAQLYPARF